MSKLHVPGCEGDRCTSNTGEVRKLPYGDPSVGANVILCLACFKHEMNYRRKFHPTDARLPRWEELNPKESMVEISADKADLENSQTLARVCVVNDEGLEARAFLSAKVVHGRVKFELEVCCNSKRVNKSATADWRL